MRRWLLGFAILLGLTSAAQSQVTDHYALLMVWMPGLCKFEPDRVECKGLTLRRFDGLNLAFMAVQSARTGGASNIYCYTMIDDESLDRQRKWCDMTQPKIANTLEVELKTLMPVTQSCQDRGLWARYASCTMYSGDEYYARAIKLAKSFNATELNNKIAAAVGTTIKQSELLDAFKADFGDEKLNAVEFFCRKVGTVSHLFQVRISVTARALTRGLGKDVLWKPQNPLHRNCPESIVIDAPPVPIAETDKNAPPAKPAPPPGQPAAPDAVPVAPVETEPLEPKGPVVR
jgi:ribonuclease I